MKLRLDDGRVLDLEPGRRHATRHLRAEAEALVKKLVPRAHFCWCGDPWALPTSPPVAHLTDKGSRDYVLQIALHEATHLIRGKGGHPPDFWVELEALVHRHLGVELNEMQAQMKRDYLQ